MPESRPSISEKGSMKKSQRERELPRWLLSYAVGTEVQIDGREGSPTRLPPAFSSVSREYIPLSATLTNIPSGRYTWMGEGWVEKITKGTTKPTNLRVGILRKSFPYSRNHPKYYYILLEK